VPAEPPPTTASQAVPLRVEEVAINDPRWDSYLRTRPEATLFHRAAWQRVAARTFRYRYRGLLARRGDRVVGALPLFQVPGLPFGASLISTPLAVYGGVVADDAEAGQALAVGARDLAERVKAGYVELRDGMRIEGLPVKDLYVTFRREMFPNHEENFARIRGKQRTSIRAAQKHGLTHVTGRAELIDRFYPIYSRSVRNLGTPVFPKSLFRFLFDELGDHAQILIVESARMPVAGVLALFDGDHVMPYYAGTLRDAYRFSASDYMYWALMCVAADRGCRVFDFGRSKRDTGAFHYKRHWGFEPTPLAYQYLLVTAASIPDLSPKNPRFGIAIRVWRRLPLAVAERIGPMLVRYFP
jgi:FemAB-related protein (PEP-CTERM system-associated)